MFEVHHEDERGQHVGSAAAAGLSVVGVLLVVVVYHVGVVQDFLQLLGYF